MAENKVAPMYQKKQATAQQAEGVVDALLKVFEQPLVDWDLGSDLLQARLIEPRPRWHSSSRRPGR